MQSERYEEWGLSGFTEDERNQAIREYAALFGLNPTNAPSTTGLAMIRLRASKIGKLSVIRNPGNLEKVFGKHQPPGILWMRKPGEGEDSIDRLYSWDKRASYLHACDIQLGVGACTKYELARGWRGGEFNARGHYRNMAGVWKVSFDEWNESEESSGLIKTVYRMVGNRQWFYTPMVVALTELGVRIRVSEGYAFPESSKLLTHWRGQFLQSLEGASPALRRMIKSTYTQAIGLLGSSQQKDKTSETSLYRPDWRGQIVDCASARMLHNMAKLNKLYPGLPLSLYDDCFYYLLEDHRPLSEMFRFDEGLRRMFRLKAVYEVSSVEARALLHCKKPAVFARDIKRYEVYSDVDTEDAR